MAGTKRKRDHDNSNTGPGTRSRPAVEPRIDPTYGQRSALPGLDDDTLDGGDNELQYDEEGMQALMYLRAVRKEATAIPNILVAPKDPNAEIDHSIYSNGVGDSRGWYHDGAYAAAPDNHIEISDEDEEGYEEGGESRIDPQTAYFDAILARFETLRERLSRRPPVDILNRLDNDHPTHVPRLNTELSRAWRWRFRNVDPLSAQLAAMDKSSILRLLGLLTTGRILKRGEDVDARVSRWAWGLLARLPERGELVSEEIGVVRELGKRAVLLGVWLKDEKAWEEGIEEVEREFEEGDDDDSGVHEGPIEEGGEVEEMVNEDEIEVEEDLEEAMIEEDEEIGEPIEDQEAIGAADQDYVIEKTALVGEGTKDTIIATSEAITFQQLTSTDDIAAAKAALLEKLQTNHSEDTIPSQTTHKAEVEKRPSIPEAQGSILPDPQAAARQNTHATVDMILTVAGELYGQRDLLEFREIWETDSTETAL
ncbi:hypothetical protein B7463_g9167, partial [Scytalidium lignicola]